MIGLPVGTKASLGNALEGCSSIWDPIWHTLRWITLVTVWIKGNDWGCSTISSAMVWKPSTSFGARAHAWWRHFTKAIETHQDQFDNDRDYLAWAQPIFGSSGNPLRSSPNHVPIKHRGVIKKTNHVRPIYHKDMMILSFSRLPWIFRLKLKPPHGLYQQY